MYSVIVHNNYTLILEIFRVILKQQGFYSKEFIIFLTLIPSNLDKALRGLRALSVLRDLMGPRSE